MGKGFAEIHGYMVAVKYVKLEFFHTEVEERIVGGSLFSPLRYASLKIRIFPLILVIINFSNTGMHLVCVSTDVGHSLRVHHNSQRLLSVLSVDYFSFFFFFPPSLKLRFFFACRALHVFFSSLSHFSCFCHIDTFCTFFGKFCCCIFSTHTVISNVKSRIKTVWSFFL